MKSIRNEIKNGGIVLSKEEKERNEAQIAQILEQKNQQKVIDEISEKKLVEEFIGKSKQESVDELIKKLKNGKKQENVVVKKQLIDRPNSRQKSIDKMIRELKEER